MSKNDYLYTEQVKLPSKGLLNPEIPEGLVTIRCIELKDQKYISGSKLVNGNKYVQLLNRCIVEPENINVINLTQIDIFFLILKLRILSYGGKYSFMTKCPVCGKPTRVDVNLEELKVTELNDDFDKNLVVTLPRKGDKVYTKIRTQADVDYIEKETLRMKEKFGDDLEGDPSVTLNIAKSIKKIELKNPTPSGDTIIEDPVDILQYVECLLDIDAISIMSTFEDLNYGVNPIITTTCNKCSEKINVILSTNPEFFRPRSIS